jgi:hypothetical protein
MRLQGKICKATSSYCSGTKLSHAAEKWNSDSISRVRIGIPLLLKMVVRITRGGDTGTVVAISFVLQLLTLAQQKWRVACTSRKPFEPYLAVGWVYNNTKDRISTRRVEPNA